MSKKKEMKQWLVNYCNGNSNLELQLRGLLKQNENLIKKINDYFSLGDLEELKDMIDGYIKMDIERVNCEQCDNINYTLIKESGICHTCDSPIRPSREIEYRRCLYCSNPVSSPSDVTCYSHKNVIFKYYSN